MGSNENISPLSRDGQDSSRRPRRSRNLAQVECPSRCAESESSGTAEADMPAVLPSDLIGGYHCLRSPAGPPGLRAAAHSQRRGTRPPVHVLPRPPGPVRDVRRKLLPVAARPGLWPAHALLPAVPSRFDRQRPRASLRVSAAPTERPTLGDGGPRCGADLGEGNPAAAGDRGRADARGRSGRCGAPGDPAAAADAPHIVRSAASNARMDPELTATLAAKIARDRKRSLLLCTKSRLTVVLSQEIRAQNRRVRHQSQQERAQYGTTRLKSTIARKLREGHLPWVSPAVISGGRGQEGDCDGCDQTLVPTQLVMAVPADEKTVIRLHADCFILWYWLRRLHSCHARGRVEHRTR